MAMERQLDREQAREPSARMAPLEVLQRNGELSGGCGRRRHGGSTIGISNKQQRVRDLSPDSNRQQKRANFDVLESTSSRKGTFVPGRLLAPHRVPPRSVLESDPPGYTCLI